MIEYLRGRRKKIVAIIILLLIFIIFLCKAFYVCSLQGTCNEVNRYTAFLSIAGGIAFGFIYELVITYKNQNKEIENEEVEEEEL